MVVGYNGLPISQSVIAATETEPLNKRLRYIRYYLGYKIRRNTRCHFQFYLRSAGLNMHKTQRHYTVIIRFAAIAPRNNTAREANERQTCRIPYACLFGKHGSGTRNSGRVKMVA